MLLTIVILLIVRAFASGHPQGNESDPQVPPNKCAGRICPEILCPPNSKIINPDPSVGRCCRTCSPIDCREECATAVCPAIACLYDELQVYQVRNGRCQCCPVCPRPRSPISNCAAVLCLPPDQIEENCKKNGQGFEAPDGKRNCCGRCVPLTATAN